MRWLIIAVLVVAVLLVGGWLSQADLLAIDVAEVDQRLAWVRTVDGWERSAAWSAKIPSTPSLHPLVVAAGQLLGSLLALNGFPSGRGSD